MINSKEIYRDIEKNKKALIRKAQRKGLWENFGQKEYRALIDKYGKLGYYDRCDNGQMVCEILGGFDLWARNYTNE